LEDGRWPPLRVHDLRHPFASHLIVDLGLDVAQVSRILGHAQITTTLSIYTHLFDDARHAHELKAKMATSVRRAARARARRPRRRRVVALPECNQPAGYRPANARRFGGELDQNLITLASRRTAMRPRTRNPPTCSGFFEWS
jgi:hypothetical protein